MTNALADLGILAEYLGAYSADPPVLNQGLVAGENLRGLEAAEPASWFSLAKVQEALRTKKDLSVQDVSGGRVIALGTAKVVAGKKLGAGDQVFYQPMTKTLLAVKTYKALQAESAKTVLAPKTVSASSSPSAALITVSVGDVQALVIRLGAPRTKAITDGAFGPSTVAAYQAQVVKRVPGADATINKVDKKRAAVSMATWLALQNAAKSPAPKPSAKAAAPAKPAPKAAKAKPTEPRRSGMLKASVGQLQDILIKLNVKLGRDGQFGPKTASAWATAAKRRKLDGAIDRAGPIEAWVVPKTFETLAAAAGVKGAEPAGQPVSAKPEAAKPVPTPGGATLSVLEPITAPQLQTVFKGFGKAPKKAPEIQVAWAQIAKANKLDGTSQISKLGLEVVPKTRDTLVKRAEIRIAAAVLVSASVTSLKVSTLQSAMKFANQTEPYKGRLEIAVSGKWGPKTEDAFFVFYNIRSEDIPAWELAFKSIVKDTTLRLPPKMAMQADAAAANYAKLKKTIDKKEAKQKKIAVVEAKSAQEVDAAVNANVGRATTLTSIFTVQQALSEIRERQKSGALPGPVLPGISLTGRWDKNTDKGLYATFSDEMWGADTIPKGGWAKLLTRVLVKSSSKSGVSGLYGVFGDLAAAPTGANYIRLPAGTAQKIQNLAADFVARSAKSGVMQESKPDVSIPVPQAGGMVAGEPVFVTGRVTPSMPSQIPSAPVTGEQMQVPMIETADGARVDVPVAPPPVPLPQELQPQLLPQPAPINVTGGAVNVNVPGAQTTEMVPAAEAATPAAEAAAPAAPKSDGWTIALAVAAGAGALFLLTQGEKEHRQQQRAKNLSSRQMNRRRRG